MSDLKVPVRKDAARNRERLLEAANELFASRGMEVTLKDVAHHAGVGVGTVYRHFPTKDDLVDALYAEEARCAVVAAEEAAADDDGWRGLVRYLEESMRAQANNCGLRGAMSAIDPSSPVIIGCRDTISPLVEQMVSRAHAQGALRPDVDAADVAHIQLALAAVMDATRTTSPDLYRNHLRFLLDGLRAESRGVGSIS